jgi:hypothetical protein
LAEAEAMISRQAEAIVELLYELAHVRAVGNGRKMDEGEGPRTGKARWRNRLPAIADAASEAAAAKLSEAPKRLRHGSRQAAALLTP